MGTSSTIELTAASVANIYKPASFFMTRMAMLPFPKDYYEQLSDDEEFLIETYRKTPLLQEAIAIASPSLFASLNSIEKLDRSVKKGNNAYLSLLKYYLRSVSRCTPFGLFSCVGSGTFADATKISFDPLSLDKRVRPDMEWIKAITDEFEKNETLVRTLKVMITPAALKNGERLYLKKRNSQAINQDLCSIKFTTVAEQIFCLAKDPIVYEELENQLAARFQSTKRETVAEYLWGFFQKGFLITELQPSMTEAFNVPAFFEKFEELRSLYRLLQAYEKKECGAGAASLSSLFSACEQWKKVKCPLQVDTFTSATLHLDRNIQREITQAFSVCIPLCCTKKQHEPLSRYLLAFQEKYGMHRLVPLLELLDEAKGLGPLPRQEVEAQEENAFLERVISKIYSNEEEVVLDEIPTLSPEQLSSLPLSMEIFFSLAGDTIVINPHVGSDQAGSCFGRFLYGLPTVKKELKEFLKEEEELLPDVLIVETSFFPEAPRTANVCMVEKTRNWQFSLHYRENSPSEIQLEDIFVGAAENRLYFFSGSHRKELYFTLASAVNLNLSPDILYFLYTFSHSRFSQFRLALLDPFEKRDYTPRVRYRNVVIKPRKWVATLSALGLTKESPREIAAIALHNYLREHSLPAYCFSTTYDQMILLNWKKEGHFDLLVDELLGQEKLTLLEFFTGGKEPHFCEYVLPFIKEAHYAPKKDLPFIPNTSIERTKRIIHPGGEWLYFKLFVPTHQEKQFLTREMNEIISSLVAQGLIQKWFYIQYKENRHHVRLRLQGDPKVLTERVLPAFHEKAENMLERGALAEYSLHPYEREVERYGGPQAIEEAETLFYADSSYCLHLLEASPLPATELATLGILNILRSFQLEIPEMIEQLQPQKEHLKHLSGTREEGKRLQSLMETHWNSFLPFAPPFEQYGALLKQEETQKWNSKNSIISSILHMHCNRMMGVDNTLEIKARVMAHHLLKTIAIRLKND